MRGAGGGIRFHHGMVLRDKARSLGEENTEIHLQSHSSVTHMSEAVPDCVTHTPDIQQHTVHVV